MNNHQLLDGICLCYEFGLADDVRAVRSGDGVWFVRLCQLLTGQPMLAAVLVLLSSTPCSPGTARGRNRRRCGHHWAVPFRAGDLRSGQGAGQDQHGTRRRLEVVVDVVVTGSVSTAGDCREASMACAQAPVSGTGPRAVPAGRHQDLIRHTWTTHR
mgnify:FL=1